MAPWPGALRDPCPSEEMTQHTSSLLDQLNAESTLVGKSLPTRSNEIMPSLMQQQSELMISFKNMNILDDTFYFVVPFWTPKDTWQ